MNTVQGQIPNHLAWSVISTILATFCCCPLGLLGIIGIVNSTKVDKLLAAGDLAGAQKASETAKLWSIIATVLLGIGLLINIGYILTMGGLGAYAELMNANGLR
ncbi:hypothetical protein CO615_01720 [Lysobacteraceae bacterium NML75-0749]|nr:hypothetical protein CO609_08865 [Xanthomonadaceae bacterium NML91-0268]PJK03194.1 hypothetical protein CO615_01720 [Xanthomonadaceae bacterium NML75-0749]